jgi:hypothetical protein
MKRCEVDKEIVYAEGERRHKSVRLVTAKRILTVLDQKTEALKTIHRMCNEALHADDLSTRTLKDIRAIASETWPTLVSEVKEGE